MAVEIEFIPLFTLTSTATSTFGLVTTYSPDQIWPVGHRDLLFWYPVWTREIINVGPNPGTALWTTEAVLGPGGEGIGIKIKTTANVIDVVPPGGLATITVTLYYFQAVRLNSARWGISTPGIRKRISTFA